MANPEHLANLKAGVEVWNKIRVSYPEVVPDLRGAFLAAMNLAGINLSKALLAHADLAESNLSGADFSAANVRDARLCRANCRFATFNKADLHRTDLSATDLRGANLKGADLRRVQLAGAKLEGTDLSGANFLDTDLREIVFDNVTLSRAILIGAQLGKSSFARADLREADLTRTNAGGANFDRAVLVQARFRDAQLNQASFVSADLRRANFLGSNLFEANLSNANLAGAQLVQAYLNRTKLTGSNLSGGRLQEALLLETELSGARLTDCRIYGISVWDVKVDQSTEQSNLIITPWGQPDIQVDSLEVAQFVYLLLNNKKIRDVIDTITSKVVLILGRFTPKRKVVLDAIRDALRNRGRLPILFDFEKPRTQTTDETISTLAHMSRFVIADLTDAKSVLQELRSIVPNSPSVIVQPLLLATQEEPGMFDFFRRFHWVLEPVRYSSENALISQLDATVIAPAEAKAKALVSG